MARSNRTRYTVLGTLTLGAMSGYDIKKFIEGSINNFWRESFGQIYPTLKHLAAEGLVTRRVEKQEGKPDRYIYEITEAGRDELREWLVEPAEPPVPRFELLLKLFFGAEVSVEANRRHVQRFRRSLEKGLHYLRGVESELPAEHPEEPGLPYWMLGVHQGIVAHEAMLSWCDTAERTLDGMGSKVG